MTTVSPKKGHDSGKVNEISEKLMGNPELARGCRILCVGKSSSYFKQGQVLPDTNRLPSELSNGDYCRVMPSSWPTVRPEGSFCVSQNVHRCR